MAQPIVQPLVIPIPPVVMRYSTRHPTHPGPSSSPVVVDGRKDSESPPPEKDIAPTLPQKVFDPESGRSYVFGEFLGKVKKRCLFVFDSHFSSDSSLVLEDPYFTRNSILTAQGAM